MDATGLSRGVSCLLLNRTKNQGLRMPRACPVESHVCCYLARGLPRKSLQARNGFCFLRAENVNLHGPRPWHPDLLLETIGLATQRESPRDRPVAYPKFCAKPPK